jgi:hypothetical protein
MKYKKALAYEKAPQVCEPRRLCLPQGQTSDTGDESILPAGAVTLEKGRFPCPSNCFTDFRQSAILFKIVC